MLLSYAVAIYLEQEQVLFSPGSDRTERNKSSPSGAQGTLLVSRTGNKNWCRQVRANGFTRHSKDYQASIRLMEGLTILKKKEMRLLFIPEIIEIAAQI
ncbi:hypothetical protein MHYP_G00244780 [Metynnis hypsauchen]